MAAKTIKCAKLGREMLFRGYEHLTLTFLAMLIATALAVPLGIFLARSRWRPAVNLVMGIVPWVAVHRVEAIRHPVDAIGRSGSTAIQGFYLLIVLTVEALAITLIAWLWARVELRAVSGSEEPRTA